MTARLIIAAPASGQGKTTVATGLMAALAQRGLKVQAFKAGPDFIDPVIHSTATGRPSRNLDTWMMGEELVLESFRRATASADIAIIEGVMGLFDGYGGKDDSGSAAHLARLLKAPVLLVVDGWAMARSCAALVHGFATFDPHVHVAGVIVNNLAGEGHYRFISEALEGTGVPLVGWLPRNPDIALPERYLGLVPPATAGHLDRLTAAVAQTVDLDLLLRIAQASDPVPAPAATIFADVRPRRSFRIAIARDDAFWFYYEDGLDYLAQLGAELVPFSPLRDERPPGNVQAVYLGGGYPELYADQLAANVPMRTWLRETTVPIYAECGGLIYLCQAIVNDDGRRHAMVGRLPADAHMAGQGLKLGYVQAHALCDHLLAKAGDTVRGHEFHCSTLSVAAAQPAWRCEGGYGPPRTDGFTEGGLLASYVHIHLAASHSAARRFAAFSAAAVPL